jgi:cytidylate kinase
MEIKMSVITIRGNLGSGAPEIGKLVAGKFHFDYVDREIIDKVAELLQGKKHDIEMKEMPPGSLSSRIGEALRRAYPTTRKVGLLPRWEYEDVSLPTWEKPLDDAHYFAGLQSVIRDLAQSSSIVIRGRGSQFILKDYPGTLRVLIVAPLQMRVKRVAESSKSDERNAKKEIENYDSSRREFIKKYFHAALENPLDFDLVINTELVTFEDAAVIIANALPLKNRPEVPKKKIN